MWRSSRFLLQALTPSLSPTARSPAGCLRPGGLSFSGFAFKEEQRPEVNVFGSEGERKRDVSFAEVRRRLERDGKEVMGYSELVRSCERMGASASDDEAEAVAKALEDAGLVLRFRDKVFLHPDRVVDVVRRAIPLELVSEEDPRIEELKKLREKKEQIDMLAHKQVRRILWTGLGVLVTHVGLFFRLTFWEFSWDVMEPIAFFTASTGLVLGLGYSVITLRDPSYQDFMKRMFLSRQRKLFKKLNFDINRYMELQRQCKLRHSKCEGKGLATLYDD